jgi:hypothetical protein
LTASPFVPQLLGFAAGTTEMNGRIFQYSLLTVTLLPITVALLPRSSDVIAVSAALGLIAGTHVFSTLYLYFTPDVFEGVWNWRWTVVAAPIALMAAVFLFLLAMPTWLLVLFMLIYIHFGIVHFGRQNLGVLTFSLRIGCQRPMDPFERRTIMVGVIAGMCAAYTAFAPALMLHSGYFPIDPTPVAPFFLKLWYLGAAIYVLLTPIAVYHAFKKRSHYDSPSLVLYLTSVLFFAPLFLSADPLIAISSWTVAHGLQYLIFLAVHAGSRTRATLAGLIPVVTLIVVACVGYLLWNTYPQWGNETLARVGAAAVVAINLAHYWVDMFLWKFQTPERRKWLLTHYAFLASGARPVSAVRSRSSSEGSVPA